MSGFVNTFSHRMRSRRGWRFSFGQALALAIALHVALLAWWAWQHRPEIIKVPFVELNIKLGRSDLPSTPREHKPSVTKIPHQAALQQPRRQVITPPPQPEVKAQPQQKVERREPKMQQQARTAVVPPKKPAVTAIPAQPAQAAQKQEWTALPKDYRQPQPYVAPQPQQPLPSAPAMRELPPENELAFFEGARGHELGNQKTAEKEDVEGYDELLAAWLAAYHFYPEEARRQKMEGRGIVTLVLEPSGKLREANLSKRTGYPLLDQAIEEMARRADPYPPVPKNEEGKFQYSVAIKFELRKRN